MSAVWLLVVISAAESLLLRRVGVRVPLFFFDLSVGEGSCVQVFSSDSKAKLHHG